jgi:hypothetical protein
VELGGYLAGGLCAACLIALLVMGNRWVRIAVAAFVAIVVIGFGIFVWWLARYGE